MPLWPFSLTFALLFETYCIFTWLLQKCGIREPKVPKTVEKAERNLRSGRIEAGLSGMLSCKSITRGEEFLSLSGPLNILAISSVNVLLQLVQVFVNQTDDLVSMSTSFPE